LSPCCVDPGRIAVIGNSYGSYTALSLLVTMPNTFSATAISAFIGVGTHGFPGEQAQAEQLFAGLRRLDRTAELRRYDGEGHSPSTWSPAAYTDFAERLLSWIGAATTI
jgi:dipeptidyl aminopeptidase/acylaminoacyl peptidase